MKTPYNILIFGGTGSLGQALIPALMEKYPDTQISIFSRDEHKQATLAKKYPKLKFYVGDIRDRDSVRKAFQCNQRTDVVFHVAALKHVDVMEANPLESIKTNVLATEILADEAVRAGVQYFVFSSTDKAVDPINTYGYCKAISEKILFDYNKKQKITSFSVYRWGNVVGSQGSAIPYFAETISWSGKAFLTHRQMTRFWIPLEWAINYLLRTYTDASPNAAMVPPVMKAARVTEVIRAVAHILGKDYEIHEVGMRPGEKLHEAMHSVHSGIYLDSLSSPHYQFDELVELIRPVVEGA